MIRNLFLPEMKEAIKLKDWETLKELISIWPAPDISDMLESLDDHAMIVLFRLLPRETAADVFREFPRETRERLIMQFGGVYFKSIINELSPDDRTELFEDLPGKVTRNIVVHLPREIREETLRLLGYPEESVGRLMTPEYIAIQQDWTVGKALQHIRKYGQDAETISMIYVVDKSHKLLDAIPLRNIILASPRKKVKSLMDNISVSIRAFEDQEEAVDKIRHYNLTAMPVVDKEDTLLGIVTVDDIIDVLDEETTEDFQKGASVMPLDQNYSSSSVFFLYRKRIIWLSFLAIAGFLSSGVLAMFENMLASFVALAFFIPILIDSGGNTGSQSATLVIRSLATGDVTPKNIFSIVKKELLVGLLLGISLGSIIFLWGGAFHGSFRIGAIVSLSMLSIIIISNIMGAVLPLVLTLFKIDPATASSPLITTVIDALGLLIYFSIAKMFLPI